jgi:hypothetical protein
MSDNLSQPRRFPFFKKAPPVAQDRYGKQIWETDQRQAAEHYTKAGLSGATIGALVKRKMPLGKAAMIGAGAGILAQAVARHASGKTKDQFGDRSHGGKRIDQVLPLAGEAGAAVLGYRKLAGKKVHFSALVETGSALDKVRTALSNRRFIAGAALTGGIGVADAVTSGVAPDHGKSRAAAASGGLGRGLLYGGVLAATEPLIAKGLRKAFSVSPGKTIHFVSRRDPEERTRDRITIGKNVALAGAGVAGIGAAALLTHRGTKAISSLQRRGSAVIRGLHKTANTTVRDTIANKINPAIGQIKHAADNTTNATALYADIGHAWRNVKGGAYNLLHPKNTIREVKAAYREGRHGIAAPATAVRPKWAMGAKGNIILFRIPVRPGQVTDRPPGSDHHSDKEARDESNRFKGSLSGYIDRDKNYLGKTISATDLPVIRSAVRKAQVANKWGTRGVALGGDAIHAAGGGQKVDARGRSLKREWEKSWFKNTVKTGILAAGVIGGAHVLRKNPKLNAEIKTVLGGIRGETARPGTGIGKSIVGVRDSIVKKTKKVLSGQTGSRISSAVGSAINIDRHLGLAAIGKIILFQAKQLHFDEHAQDAGWDVRDPRGRSARVFAPGSRRRERREKFWHEKSDNQRRILTGVAIAGTLAAGAGAFKITRGLDRKAQLSALQKIRGYRHSVTPPMPPSFWSKTPSLGGKTIQFPVIKKTA